MTDQENAFNKLSRLKCGALFMQMGTGKTKVALDLISSKKVDTVIWICPCSIKEEIHKENMKWHPEIEMKIVGCESIGMSDRIYIEIFNGLEKSRKSFLVVDESLKIKNKDAKRTQRIMKLGEMADYRLILNGTPLSKNCMDLWTQMQFLSPKILNMSYNQFKNQYTEYYVRGRLRGLVKKQHNIDHLISKIRPYIFDSELNIEAGKNYYKYSYSIEDKNAYESLKRSILNQFENEDQIDFFILMTQLQKFYVKSKKVLLEELIKEIPGRKVVFVKYLESIPVDADRITGEVKNREEVISEFRDGGIETLYMTYGCGSFGLNLQFCKNIIFAEHTFDFSMREQAEARIYRIGQENDVNYYDLTCRCGLEDMIMASIDKKQNLLLEVKREIEKEGVEKWAKSI